MTLKRIFFALLLFLISQVYAQVNAFQIAGSIKTQSKDKGNTEQIHRREVRVDVDTKVLELKIRRINPTIGENVTIYWAVWKEFENGRTTVATKGSRETFTQYGAIMELTSDPFELVEVDVDRNRGFGNDREQDVDGYAVIILDENGQEVGKKFQPARIEKEARAMMAKAFAKQENPKVRNENVQRQIEERRRRKAIRK